VVLVTIDFDSDVPIYQQIRDRMGHGERARDELAARTGAFERDLNDYRRHPLARFPNSRSQRERSRAAIRLLWRWRRHLAEDALRFDPLHLDGWGESKQSRRGENDTDRLPEEIIGPLVVWALRFVDDFAADILEADRRWHEARTATLGPSHIHSRVGSRLQRLLDEYVAAGRPLPGYEGRPNLAHILVVTAGPSTATAPRSTPRRRSSAARSLKARSKGGWTGSRGSHRSPLTTRPPTAWPGSPATCRLSVTS
jgi:hypothetical protein